MKATLKIEHRGKVYGTYFEEISEKQFEKLSYIVEVAIKDKLDLFYRDKNKHVFFGEQIVKESIITLEKKN